MGRNRLNFGEQFCGILNNVYETIFSGLQLSVGLHMLSLSEKMDSSQQKGTQVLPAEFGPQNTGPISFQDKTWTALLASKVMQYILLELSSLFLLCLTNQSSLWME